MQEAQRRVLVAGSTGYLGRHVVRAAAARGYRVRAVARRPKKLAEEAELIELVVQAEATKPGTLTEICEGVDVVFSSLGITKQADGLRYADVDYQANLNLLREAERAGVERFVYVSVLHPEHTLHTDMVREKERFVAALQASPVEHVIVRPTGFFSDMGEFLDMARSGRAYVFGDGSAKLNPIHGADLAEFCVDTFCPEFSEREVEVGGPETLTQREIAKLAFAALETPAKVSGVPLWVIDGALPLVKLFSRRWWNIVAFMSGAGRHEMVGPAHGERRLGDFFTERARAS